MLLATVVRIFLTKLPPRLGITELDMAFGQKGCQLDVLKMSIRLS